MTATVDIDEQYPVTVNDEAAAEWLLDLAREAFGPDRVIRHPRPMMGSEDFSYVLHKVPGAFASLGTCPPGADPNRVAMNHSNKMVIDEDATGTGIELYARIALAALA
jgi:hippurate hydrolase